MSDAVDRFDEQKETIRAQLEEAIRVYQELATIDLGELTRENAAELYTKYVGIEAAIEGVGGVLDRIRSAIQTAGDCFTEEIERVGFAGDPGPIITTDVVEGEE